MGFVVVLLPAIISQYFGKDRAAACGLSYAGAASGAFIFPLFIEWQIAEYGLKGSFLLMGGITMHALIGAFLLRPAKWYDRRLIWTSQQSKAPPLPARNYNSTSGNVSPLVRNDLEQSMPLIENCDTRVIIKNAQSFSTESIHKISKFRPKSIADFGMVSSSSTHAIPKMRDSTTNRITRNNYKAHRMSLPVMYSKHIIKQPLPPPPTSSIHRLHSIDELDGGTNFGSRKSINKPLPPLPSKKEANGSTMPIADSSVAGSVWRQVREDAKILLNYHFHLVTVTYVIYVLDFIAFIIILPDFAKDRGFEHHDGVLLLSIFSITDLAGRLIPGWISYANIVSNRNIFASSIGVMGIGLVLMPMAYSFTHLVCLTLLCGFVTGCQMVLPPVVLSEYLGVERTAIGFGISNFICGVIIIFRPFIIGMLDCKVINTKKGKDIFVCIRKSRSCITLYQVNFSLQPMQVVCS